MILDTLANFGEGISLLFLTIGMIGILLVLLKITFGEESICEDIDNHSADNSNTDFVVCKEDLDHHSKVFGTALKGVDTMIERSALIKRLKGYDNAPAEINHALETLAKNNSEFVSNDDIGDVWERVSKAIDNTFSDDDSHDAWKLELELSKAYRRD